MLNKFRETAITWDKANRKIYESLRVSAGDNKGRKLSVQLVNDGVIEDLSGASLSLFWETKDKAHKGLDAFTAVDATKGEFEIYYTTGMLSNEGILNANLVLVDISGRVVSEPFTITVFKGINDDAIQSSDSFTALTTALAQVGNINNKADRAELLALESIFEQNKVSVEQQLQQAANDLESGLADKATKIEVNSGLIGKVDKGGNEQVTFAMLAQNVKEAFTGGNVAVVGEGAVNTTNIVDGAVTYRKRSKLGNTGFYHLHGTAELPTINTQTRVITFKPPFYIMNGNTRYALTTEMTVTYLNNALYQYILFNTQTQTFRVVAGAAESTSSENELLVMSLNLNGDTSLRNYWFTNQLIIDGKNTNGLQPKTKLRLDQRSQLGGLAMYTTTNKFRPNIDTVNKKVTFYKDFYLTYGNQRYSFTTSDVETPIYSNSLIQYIVYNVALNTIRTTVASQENILREDDILIMVINLNADLSIRSVFFTSEYTIDFEKTTVSLPKYQFSPEPFVGFYQPSATLGFEHMRTVVELYDMYDALHTASGGYLTRTQQGLDASGTYPLWEYTAKMPTYNTKNGKTKPKIIITPGIHGGERQSVNAWYYFMKDLCENWETDSRLRDIRENIEIIFTPVANPHAYQNGIRANANGVDINRNFGQGWTLGTVGDPFYGGTAPFSEIETRFVRNMIQSNPDALIYIDFHTNGSTGDKYDNMLWHMINTDKYYNPDIDSAASFHIEKMSVLFKERYGVPTSEEFTGYSTYQNLGGSAGLYGATLLENSTTFEVFNKFPDEGTYGTVKNITACTDAIGNWIFEVIKHFKYKK